MQTRRPRRGIHGVWLVALLLASAAVAASTPPSGDLEGTLGVSRIGLAGAWALSSETPRAFQIRSADEVFEGSMSLVADRVVVNWTYRIRESYGLAPTGQDGVFGRTVHVETREDAYLDASVVGVTNASDASFMVRAAPGLARTAFGSASTATIEASRGETWHGGQAPNVSGMAWQQESSSLTYRLPIPRGDLVTTIASLDRVEVVGDVVVYVWGLDLTLTDAEGAGATFKTGNWQSNQTGTQAHPYGVTRSEHYRLVRLTLTNATLEVTPTSGTYRWAALDAEAETRGVVTFHDATGRLLGASHAYEARGEDVTVTGLVAQRVAHDADSDAVGGGALRSLVSAQAAIVSLSGAPLPAGDTPGTGGAVAWWVVGVAGLLAAPALVAFLLRLRRTLGLRGPLDERLAAAEAAMTRGDVDVSDRYVASVLKTHPTHPQARSLRGVALLKRHQYEDALGVLLPLAQEAKGEHHADTAFLIAFAYVHLGDEPAARTWARAACRSPDIQQRMAEDDRFRHVLDWRAVRRGVRADPAYG